MDNKERKWEIAQVCLVVNDLEATMKAYWEKLGIGPWNISTLNKDTCKDYHFNGQVMEDGFDFKCACCWVGNVEMEICQPITDQNPAAMWLKEHGEGLHHIKLRFNDKDLDEAITFFGGNGMPILHSGKVDKDRWYYPDTLKDLKINLEIGNSGDIAYPADYYPEQPK